jgi:hypothetical protein
MIDLWRVLPTVVLSGGLVAAAGPTLDLVKAGLTHYELVQMANLMVMDWNLNCVTPPRTADQLSDFIAENMTTNSGRDLTRDFWGHAYAVQWSARTELVLYSPGPNGQRNGCGESSWQQALNDRIQSLLAVQGTDTEASSEQPTDVRPAPPGRTGASGPAGSQDDVCVRVSLEPCQGNGRVDSRGRQSR